MKFPRLYAIFLALCSLPAPAFIPEPGVWLLVDTQDLSLSVMDGERLVEYFGHVAIGRRGSAELRLRGDHRTPLGEFRIAWINRRSPFRLFFGLNYPTLAHAQLAYNESLIDKPTYDAIRMAALRKETPPQNTLLGGRIGIHGLGSSDLDIHREFNWTQGCVALTNSEIERLGHWIDVGTRVVIR